MGPAGAQRLFDEARLMARVTSPRGVRAIDAGTSLVFVVYGTARLTGGGDEPRMAFEEESKVQEKIDA